MKKIFGFLFFLISVSSLAQVSDATLTTSANTIKNETTPGANTATRIGNMLINIINSKINVDKIKTDLTDNSDSYVASQQAVYEAVSARAGKLQKKTLTGTTYTLVAADSNYVMIATNVAGITITLGDEITDKRSFTFIRGSGAGAVTFDDDGTSVLYSVGNELVIENENGWATWIKDGATTFYGTGALGDVDGGGGGTTYTFTASDFNESGTTVSLDYANGQAASASVNGFLSSADYIKNRKKYISLSCSDLTSTLTSGTNKAFYYVANNAITITGVRAMLLDAQESGTILTIDINEAGTTILSTKLTIDNTENRSETAATAAVISDTAIAAGALLTIDFDAAGTGGAGVIVEIEYYIN